MSTKTKPSFISYDTEQWRRDIRAFANTTREALDAIVSELSNQCSGNAVVRPATAESKKISEADSACRSRATTPTRQTAATSDSNSETGDRLAQLKKRLAEKLGDV